MALGRGQPVGLMGRLATVGVALAVLAGCAGSDPQPPAPTTSTAPPERVAVEETLRRYLTRPQSLRPGLQIEGAIVAVHQDALRQLGSSYQVQSVAIDELTLETPEAGSGREANVQVTLRVRVADRILECDLGARLSELRTGWDTTLITVAGCHDTP